MNTLYTILIVFEAFVCFLLIGIVLLQKSTGDGNGLSFGSGAESVFGAQTGNVLTRSTVVLAVLFLVNTLALCVIRPTATGGESRGAKIQKAQEAERAAAAANAAQTDEKAAALLDGDVEPVESNPVAEPSAVEPNTPAADTTDTEPAADTTAAQAADTTAAQAADASAADAAPVAEPAAPATPAAPAP